MAAIVARLLRLSGEVEGVETVLEQVAQNCAQENT